MKKIYRGWWIALTCTLLMALAFGPGMNLSGVFVKPIAEDFGVTRTVVTAQTTLYTFASMLVSFFVGRIMRKVNLRGLMSASTLLVGVSYGLRFFCTAISQLYVLSAIAGFAIVLTTQVPISILINNWFGPKWRGKVMGVVMAGTGIGAMVLTPVLSYINETLGWRFAYLLIGAAILVLVLPMVFFLVRTAPEDMGLVQLGGAQEHVAFSSKGLTLKQAVKMRMFWCQCLVFLFFAVCGSLYTTNALAYLNDIGFTAMEASFMMSLASGAMVVGKIALGVICDKVGVRKSALSVSSLVVVGAVLLIFASQIRGLALAGVMLYCLGTSVPTVTMAMMTEELYGHKQFASILSVVNIFSNLGISIGPILGTLIFDMTQSYQVAWFMMTGMSILLVVCIWLAYRQRNAMELPD